MKKEMPIFKYVLLGISCVLALMALLVTPHLISKAIDRQNQIMLQEISTKNAENIGFKLEELYTFLDTLAEHVDSSDFSDPKATIEHIETQPTRLKYKRFGVALPDGTCYTSDGQSLVISNTKYINECIKNDRMVVSRIDPDDSVDGDAVFVMHKPLKQDGRVVSALFLSLSVDEVKANFISGSFNGSEIFYVVDSDGKNIINTHTDPHFRDLENLFYSQPLDPKYKGSRIATIKSDMQQNKSGVIMSWQNSNFHFYYAPLNFNNWYLFSVVPATTVNANRNIVIAFTFAMCVFLVIIFGELLYIIVSAEKRRINELDKILYVDSLTNGPSYAKFCVDVKKQLVKGKKAAYIVMDLDNFKLINDYYGYEQGNRTIKFIYELWKNILNDNEFVGRIAADRFAVYLHYSDENELTERLEKFCKLCTYQSDTVMSNYILTPSIGVYFIKNKNKNIQKMQNCAVMAKSLVKGDNDAFISFYNDELKQKLTQQKLYADEIAHAIEKKELYVVFQPQFTAENNNICGAEALIRWKKSDGTVVSPGLFIPIAEKHGLIKELDKAAFFDACKKQKEITDNGFEPIDISVNLSQQSLQDKNIVSNYYEIVKETGADISHIQLEVTESALFDNNQVFVNRLKEFSELGFKILMDDFGTGYSSLMLLKSMPIDYLKLDKSFVDDYNHPRGKHIMEAIINMAKRLGIVLIAEGVETEEQYDYIKGQGCNIIQGFYLSRPIEFDALCDMISNDSTN